MIDTLAETNAATLDRRDEINALQQRFATLPGRCPYCDWEGGGWFLVLEDDPHDPQPGDILWDGEFWTPCHHCNFRDGAAVSVPPGAIIIKGGNDDIPIQEGE